MRSIRLQLKKEGHVSVALTGPFPMSMPPVRDGEYLIHYTRSGRVRVLRYSKGLWRYRYTKRSWAVSNTNQYLHSTKHVWYGMPDKTVTIIKRK